MQRWITTALLASAFLSGSASAHPASATKVDIDNFRGSFVLDDGRTLSVSQLGRRYFADIDGRARTELVATEAASFASRDGKLALHFVQHANGNVSGVRLVEAAPR